MKLEGKIAVVTGASRGIGRAVAERYIQEGARVVAVARTTGALEELDDYAKSLGNRITIAAFDLAETNKISELGYALHQKFDKVDILVGNAGILGGLSPVGHFEPRTWERVIDINLNANWHLIRSLDPLLRHSDAGRAIFVTAPEAQTRPPYYAAYAASKAGLEAMVEIYAKEVRKMGIKANLVRPEKVATKLREEALPGEDKSSLPKPQDITDIFVDLAMEEQEETGKIYSAELVSA